MAETYLEIIITIYVPISLRNFTTDVPLNETGAERPRADRLLLKRWV